MSIAIHRYRPEFGPFQNICSLPEPEAELILARKRQQPGHGWLVPTYLAERREVEDWLRAGHRANGGTVLDEYPVYLSLWPELPKLGPHDIVVDLLALPADRVSYTYPDSMISHGLAFRMRPGEEHERRPYHGRVFDTPGLDAVIGEYGWPQEAAGAQRRSNYDRSVEAQVWDTQSLRELNPAPAILGRERDTSRYRASGHTPLS
jgi:hypothetical protein